MERYQKPVTKPGWRHSRWPVLCVLILSLGGCAWLGEVQKDVTKVIVMSAEYLKLIKPKAKADEPAAADGTASDEGKDGDKKGGGKKDAGKTDALASVEKALDDRLKKIEKALGIGDADPQKEDAQKEVGKKADTKKAKDTGQDNKSEKTDPADKTNNNTSGDEIADQKEDNLQPAAAHELGASTYTSLGASLLEAAQASLNVEDDCATNTSMMGAFSPDHIKVIQNELLHQGKYLGEGGCSGNVDIFTLNALNPSVCNDEVKSAVAKSGLTGNSAAPFDNCSSIPRGTTPEVMQDSDETPKTFGKEPRTYFSWSKEDQLLKDAPANWLPKLGYLIGLSQWRIDNPGADSDPDHPDPSEKEKLTALNAAMESVKKFGERLSVDVKKPEEVAQAATLYQWVKNARALAEFEGNFDAEEAIEITEAFFTYTVSKDLQAVLTNMLDVSYPTAGLFDQAVCTYQDYPHFVATLPHTYPELATESQKSTIQQDILLRANLPITLAAEKDANIFEKYPDRCDEIRDKTATQPTDLAFMLAKETAPQTAHIEYANVDCNCAQPLGEQTLYGIYPFWDSVGDFPQEEVVVEDDEEESRLEATASFNYGAYNRIGYYAGELNLESTTQPLRLSKTQSHLNDRQALLKAATRYLTDVDMLLAVNTSSGHPFEIQDLNATEEDCAINTASGTSTIQAYKAVCGIVGAMGDKGAWYNPLSEPHFEGVTLWIKPVNLIGFSQDLVSGEARYAGLCEASDADSPLPGVCANVANFVDFVKNLRSALNSKFEIDNIDATKLAELGDISDLTRASGAAESDSAEATPAALQENQEKKSMDILVAEQKTKRAKINIMITGSEVESFATVSMLSSLIKRHHGGAPTVADNILIFLPEPVSPAKKRLRTLVEKLFSGQSRRFAMRSILPIRVDRPLIPGVVPRDFSTNAILDQTFADLNYFEDNFGGVATWGLVSNSAPTSELALLMESVFDTHQSVLGVCLYICPNRTIWVGVLGFMSIMLAGLMVWQYFDCSVRDRFVKHDFKIFSVAALVATGWVLLVWCVPDWDWLLPWVFFGVLLAVIVPVGLWIFGRGREKP